MTGPFQAGAQLCEQFYWRCVRPLLEAGFPGLPHAAALLDSGSEVLGFDDAMSTDHNWGPRVLIFLQPADYQRDAQAVQAALAQHLPAEFAGYPTNFTTIPSDAAGPVNHSVPCHIFQGFVAQYLNFDSEQLEPVDWLTFSEQRLLTLTSGPVYYDAIGLNAARARFSYYPRDVWLYLLAAGWTRLGQEDHLMGRAGGSGDELGSALIGARLVRDSMRLCFLMARTYAPYAKWFGSAFKRLGAGPALAPLLDGALQAQSWQQRETYLVAAYTRLAAQHNALGLTERLSEEPRTFFGRPFQVVALHGFAAALLRQIQDPRVQAIAQLPVIGGLDLFSDNTDLHANPFWRPRLRRLYTIEPGLQDR